MHSKERGFLSEIYLHYQQTGDRSMQYNYYRSDHSKQDIICALDSLHDEGYIEYIYQATGFCGIKITPEGIRFAENGFKDIQNTIPSISGNNNIFVSGSGNTVSHNYNHVITDISNSDIPEECKELISTLIYELKNPSLSQEKKSSKIKQFLADISSGTLSNIASSGLTALLMTLFNNISL